MGEQHTQFKIYTDEAKIPGYQRAWVWGTVAMAILLCGLAAGWLFSHSGVGTSSQIDTTLNTSAISATKAAEWLAQQEAVNRQLQERISQLERVLAGGDSCGPTALEALAPSAGNL